MRAQRALAALCVLGRADRRAELHQALVPSAGSFAGDELAGELPEKGEGGLGRLGRVEGGQAGEDAVDVAVDHGNRLAERYRAYRPCRVRSAARDVGAGMGRSMDKD